MGQREVSRYLVPQIPEETGLSRKARWGKAEGGLNQTCREGYFFVWLIRWIVPCSFVDTEVTQPTPCTPVPTAGVAVGNRGETLGRRGGERQGTQRPEEEELSRGEKNRLKKATSPVWTVWVLFKTSEFRGMTSNWQGLLVSGDPWMASAHKLALQSLQIRSIETSQRFQRKRNHMLLNPLSVTPFQGVSQMGTSLPCLSKFGLLWFCSCGEEGWKRYRRYWRGAWKTGEWKQEKQLCPAQNGPSSKGVCC